RLHHNRAASGERGPPLPRHHQRGEVPWNDLADDAYGLTAGVGEVLPSDRDRCALDLVGPTGVVANAVDHQRNVGPARIANRLAVVERLERREFVRLFFEQVGELAHEDATIASVHTRPLAAVELSASR